MKILVVCQYYYPEPFRINDICEELVKRGHKVTVVTGTPNYPMGEIYDGYENGQHGHEYIDGVEIYRCSIIPRKTSSIHRLLNYYSYPLKSGRIVSKLDDDYDVVFINQLSPVMMAKAGIKYAKKHKISSVLYCLDLWPESLSAGGIDRTSLIFKWFRNESKRVYQNVDKILVTSKSFIDYMEREFSVRNVSYLPQYAEDIFTPIECHKNPNEFFDIMFAGNVGTAQNVDAIIECAKRCLDIKKLRWHIVGDGVELERLKKMSIGLPITFYGRQPISEMPKFYAIADAMLVTMRNDNVLNMTLPGKVQSYMAAGKMILGIANGETPRIIDMANCGKIASTSDKNGLENIIREILKHNNVDELGRNARKFYDDNFSQRTFIDELERTLNIYIR